MATLKKVWIADAPGGIRRGPGNLAGISMRVDLDEWRHVVELNNGGRGPLWMNTMEVPVDHEMLVQFGYLDIDSLYELYGAIRKYLKERENGSSDNSA